MLIYDLTYEAKRNPPLLAAKLVLCYRGFCACVKK